MNTDLANTVIASKEKTQYDMQVKKILSCKEILAHILVHTVDEFKDMDPDDVVGYIEGEPKIETVPIEPGLTNTEQINASGQLIVGLNTEKAEFDDSGLSVC